MLELGAENILCGHEYDKIGYIIRRKDAVSSVLRQCLAITLRYQLAVDRALSKGNTDPTEIAGALIREYGCGNPEYLFMAVYTVCEHMRLSAVRLAEYMR